MNHLFQWPPQPSTLIAGATLLGGAVWYATGSDALAGLVAVGVAALLPDNSGAGGQVAAGVAAIEKAVTPLGKVIVAVGMLAGVLALTACGQTPAQIVATVQRDQASVQADLDKACADVAAAETLANLVPPVAALPQAQTIEGFIAGSCIAGQATAALVTKAVTDPTTVAWTENLATELTALMPAKSP